MKIKKFNEGFDTDYIQVGDFETTIEVNSPNYGKYFMTKVLTIDLIKACENMKLGTVHDFYSKFRIEMGTSKSVSLESKRFGGERGQDLKKFEMYVPLIEHNMDWEDKTGRMKQLPVAYTKEWVIKKINEITF
jgi:hypothetical protein